jgi:hypothetical protein
VTRDVEVAVEVTVELIVKVEVAVTIWLKDLEFAYCLVRHLELCWE